MKISLIYVRDGRFFSAPSLKFTDRRKKQPYEGGRPHYVFGEPPLGIMYLSSVLKAAGHKVSLSDQCHPEYSDEKYIAQLLKERPELVGISFLSNMCYPTARSLSTRIKAALPDAKIVFGGVFSTINAAKIVAAEESVDIVAKGEGEGIIKDLAEGLDRLEDIPGIVFRSETGAVIETPERKKIEDLDTIPFPDRHALDINYVASLPLDVPAVLWDRPYTTILSSRGCPYGCSYCNCPTFSGKRCRNRSAANVLKEIEEIKSQGFRAFTFLDDNFLLDPARVFEICKGMQDSGSSFQWACEGRADPRVYDAFKELSAAGCDLVMFGIESGSQRVLNNMNKKTKIPEIEKAVTCAKEAGIGIRHGFFIVGSPGETSEEVKQSFDFAERLDINSFNFNSLTAFRGTQLWRDAVAKGLVDDEKDWDKMFSIHEIFPDALDSKTLFTLRSDLMKRLIRRKIIGNPREAVLLLRRFIQCMSMKDLYRLLTSTKSDHTRTRV